MAFNGHTTRVLYIISCCFTLSTAENVSITDGATLRQYLCPDTGTLPPNTHLLLSKPKLVLPDEGSRFCLIENTTNLSISPSQDVLSEGHDYVNISCNSAEVGFGFFNVTNLAISSVLFHTCSAPPSSEAVKYVNETNQFLYYAYQSNLQVYTVLFFSHCYNIKLHNTYTGGQLLGVNLCGDSEIKIILPDGISEKGDFSWRMELFLYFIDTAILSPTLHSNLNITSNGITSPFGRAGLTFSDRVRVDYYSDFFLFLTQSFLVNVNLNIGSPKHFLGTLATVAFVNSDTASQVSFQEYDRPYKLCANPDSNENGHDLVLKVLFYETSDFTSNVKDILHPMWIHNATFTSFVKYMVNGNILVIQKLTGKLSHKVSLDNVSWCDMGNRNDVDFTALFLAQNLATPSNKTVGELYLSLNNVLAKSNFFRIDIISIQDPTYLMNVSFIKQIYMTGTNFFRHNDGGTVIQLVASELAVTGNLTIMGGHAHQGGGITMDCLSTLAFEEPLVASFYNNIADQGSAIYSPCEQNIHDTLSTLQVRPDKKYSLSNVTSINISLYFWNNTQ